MQNSLVCMHIDCPQAGDQFVQLFEWLFNPVAVPGQSRVDMVRSMPYSFNPGNVVHSDTEASTQLLHYCFADLLENEQIASFSKDIPLIGLWMLMYIPLPMA